TLKEEALTQDEKTIRDWGLVLLIGECGLKSTEASHLTWGDIWLEENSVQKDKKYGGSLRVPGANERLVPFSHELKAALDMLQEARSRLCLASNLRDKLFFGFHNITRLSPSPALHRHGIKFVLYEVCQRVLNIPYNSESLRNHAIMSWVEQNLSNEKVAELAGYSSLNSLERFLQTSRAKRQPGRKLNKK
ncbi:MAG: site-specific integrase, partial [Silvanigrellaceae bacterium]|nr:site-specific integrase [Silvanigrellaceae bacterium]